MKQYGFTYMGSKLRIADDIISHLPAGKRLVDLMGGGGAIAHCAALSGKWEKVWYNDVDWSVVQNMRRIISGYYTDPCRFEPYWVDRDQFSFSDDREPKGTAGRPILNVLAGSGITNILCTVVRYFGGTLLGTGGLVKAYTKGAKDAIEKLPTKPNVKEISFELETSYDIYDSIKYMLKRYDVKITDEQFSEIIKIKAIYEESKFEDIEREIFQLTAGKIKINK